MPFTESPQVVVSYVTVAQHKNQDFTMAPCVFMVLSFYNMCLFMTHHNPAIELVQQHKHLPQANPE